MIFFFLGPDSPCFSIFYQWLNLLLLLFPGFQDYLSSIQNYNKKFLLSLPNFSFNDILLPNTRLLTFSNFLSVAQLMSTTFFWFFRIIYHLSKLLIKKNFLIFSNEFATILKFPLSFSMPSILMLSFLFFRFSAFLVYF